MRRASIIIVVLVGILVGCFLAVPRLILHSAKTQAVKKYASEKFTEKTLNTVPKSPPQRVVPTPDYQSTVWMSVADTECRLGFPADRFHRDDHPKRENAVIHHSRYRALILSGARSAQFASVMQSLGFTNLYDFVLNVFRATERDISQQSSMDSLQRQMVLLDAKLMLAPVGFDDSCIEFIRDDLRGFIIGDPARTKNLYVLVYIESKQQFIDLGVIQEAPIHMSDLEELISVLKVGSNSAAAKRRPTGQSDVPDNWASQACHDMVLSALL
jgi:hypothetical protein